MASWTEHIAADQLAAPAAEARPGRVLAAASAATRTALGGAKTAWPYVLRVAGGLAEAVSVLFVAVGWVLGFLFWYCPKGAFYGFCEGGRILPPAERAARRQAVRKEPAA